MTELLNHLSYPEHLGPFVRGSGQYLFDSNERKYLDFGLGGGSQIFGHSAEIISSNVAKSIKDGSVFCAPSKQAESFGKNLTSKLSPFFENHVLCSSGTEATQRAVRFARQFTQKKLILSFFGGWHGINEWTLSNDAGNRFGKGVNCLNGIPNELEQFKLQMQPYDLDALNDILKENKDIAALIIEPIPGSNPTEESLSFFKSVRGLCAEHKVLVIADEIISGFRLASGAISCSLDCEPPDMVVFGKALGGGLPFGVLSISPKIKAGLFTSSSVPLMGGTFSGNPLTTALAQLMLQTLEDALLKSLNRDAEIYRDHFNKCAKRLNSSIRIRGVGSFNRIVFTTHAFKTRAERDELEWPPDIQSEFRAYCYKRGILLPGNGLIFTSTLSKISDFETLIDAVRSFEKE